LALFLLGMAGVYFFFRGVGDFRTGGSFMAGTVFVLLGLACYGGVILTGRWLRRRSHHPDGSGGTNRQP
jgi:drug/metabolite transporter (DMT)-like permease